MLNRARRASRNDPARLFAAVLLLVLAHAAAAQPLDLTQGGPITVTARDGIEWHQAEQEVIALGDARAVRQNVTVTADRLIAYYRKKAAPDAATVGAGAGGATRGAAMTQPAPVQQAPVRQAPGRRARPSRRRSSRGRAIRPRRRYRHRRHRNLSPAGRGTRADFHRHRPRPGRRAVYDIDQAVLVMTGHDLRLTTPNDVLTSRDTMEYWPQKHMAVARGNAVVVTKDARRVAADVLVAYTATPTAGRPRAHRPARLAADPHAANLRPRSPTPPAADRPASRPTMTCARRASWRRSRRSATSRSAPRPTPRSANAPSMSRIPASRGWRATCALPVARTNWMGRRRR